MRTTSSRDNWERLVAAVIRRDQIWQLCHQDSITTIHSSDYSQRDLSFSNNSLRSVSISPSPQLPLANNSLVEVRKYGSGKITQKLFSGLLWRKKPKLVSIPEDHFGIESFSLRDLQVATDNFSRENILGRCAFSEVFKGRLADGSLVAVKRLKEEAQVMIGEEIEISSNIVAHRNVIGLRGFCIAGKQRLLVYPYMANGSVAACLRERQESQPPLDWACRPRIALGVARGLAHLHHGCIRVIMHRDVNSANILLDENFEAVVADFTLAKFLDCNDDYGYIEHLSALETDVYDYGVFLLELITAQRPFADRIWVMELYGERNFEAMVDGDLKGNFIEEEVEELLPIALLCIQSNPEVRPTMPEVVRMLEDADGLAENWEDDSYEVSPDRLSGPR